jgi:hypothetical protein
MGLVDIGSAISSGIDDLKQAASDAANTVEQKASSAADTVEEKAADVAPDAEDGAKKVGQWAAHESDAGASYLQDKLNPGRPNDAAEGVEAGGETTAAERTVGEDDQVDLSSRDKVEEFLNQWGQEDSLDDTKFDAVRCTCNTAIAGMLMNGGPAELEKGLRAGADKAENDASAAPSPQKEQLADAAQRLREAADAARDNNLTPAELDRASDALYKTFADPNNIDWKNGSPKKTMFQENGTLYTRTIGGLDEWHNRVMEKSLGLTGGESPDHLGSKSEWNPANWLKSNKQETAENVWKDIPPGTSAHVGVRGGGDYMGHAVLFGREKNGARYIYDPDSDPKFMSEATDKAKFDERVEKEMIARKQGTTGDATADVTHYS